jgi:hypothetical protein
MSNTFHVASQLLERIWESITGCKTARSARMRQLVSILTFIGEYVSNDDGCCHLTQTFVWHHTPLKFFTDDNCNTALYILATKNPPAMSTDGFPAGARFNSIKEWQRALFQYTNDLGQQYHNQDDPSSKSEEQAGSVRKVKILCIVGTNVRTMGDRRVNWNDCARRQSTAHEDNQRRH